MSDFEGIAKIFDDETAKELGIDDYVKNVVIPAETICPECGSKLVPDSGCMYCPFCGWSLCK